MHNSPTVSSIQSNGFAFNVRGYSGLTVVIESSPDFVNWSPLVTNVIEAVPWEFMDPAATNLPERFYRVRLP